MDVSPHGNVLDQQLDSWTQPWLSKARWPCHACFFCSAKKTFLDSVVGSMILNAPTQKALVLHSISFISDNFVDRAYWIGSQFSKGNSTYVAQYVQIREAVFHNSARNLDVRVRFGCQIFNMSRSSTDK